MTIIISQTSESSVISLSFYVFLARILILLYSFTASEKLDALECIHHETVTSLFIPPSPLLSSPPFPPLPPLLKDDQKK
jgi:hypothetical protein